MRGLMKRYVTDDTIGRYFRRYQLGLRFVAHGARSQTAREWTGLTRDQLATLRRRWEFGPDKRPGPGTHVVSRLLPIEPTYQ
jgi:hypothetical protein